MWSPGSVAAIGIVVVFAAIVVRYAVRVARDVRRRAAHEQDCRVALEQRLLETTALLEARVSRLEMPMGGSRSQRRREATELVREGSDAFAVARRFGLTAAELELLTASHDSWRGAA